jgi:hypothetical protein
MLDQEMRVESLITGSACQAWFMVHLVKQEYVNKVCLTIQVCGGLLFDQVQSPTQHAIETFLR